MKPTPAQRQVIWSAFRGGSSLEYIARSVQVGLKHVKQIVREEFAEHYKAMRPRRRK